MFKLAYQTPGNADRRIRDIYDNFPSETGPPKPLLLMSASPGFLSAQHQVIRYFGSHATLSFQLLAAIRFVAADIFDYNYCMTLNGQILSSMGAGHKDLKALRTNPDKAPLEKKEQKMVKFIGKALQSPGTVKKKDIEDLRESGWNDSDILDALAHGSFMKGHAILMEAFGI